MIKFLILSGQRINEITNLKWSDINDDSFEIPKERSKNMQKIITPLTTHMKDILSLVSQRDIYIFSYDGIKQFLTVLSQLKNYASPTIQESQIGRIMTLDAQWEHFLVITVLTKIEIMTVLNNKDSFNYLNL